MLKVLKSIGQHLYPYATFRMGKDVYLTFDDGPIPEVTPHVLAILRSYNVKATFFMVGENIQKHPDIYEQVIRDGHSIGNHTFNHLKGWKTPFEQYMANVAKWEQAMLQANADCHIPQDLCSKTNLFRPPYGKATWRQRKALHDMGYQLIYWDVLTRDYNPSVSAEQILRTVKKQTRPGSIINFHDSIKSNERMISVLPGVIEWLQAQGYTISQLDK